MARPKKILAGLLLGLLFTLSSLSAWVLSNPGLEASPDWFYEHLLDLKLAPQIQVEKLKGGGYFYLLDGRDLWLRFYSPSLFFEANHRATSQLPSYYISCNQTERETIRQWFIKVLSQSPRSLFGLRWRSSLSQEDAQSLNDPANLDCFVSGEIENELGEYPPTVGYWLLFNRQTKFYYWRYANYN